MTPLPACAVCDKPCALDRVTFLVDERGVRHSFRVVCSERCAERDARSRWSADVEFHDTGPP